MQVHQSLTDRHDEDMTIGKLGAKIYPSLLCLAQEQIRIASDLFTDISMQLRLCAKLVSYKHEA